MLAIRDFDRSFAVFAQDFWVRQGVRAFVDAFAKLEAVIEPAYFQNS
jgi:hypothetical protein